MQVDFARPLVPAVNFEMTLNCIYHVMADITYQVEHPPLAPGQYVLIMTRSGCGFLEADGHSLLLSAGDAVLIEAHERLDYRCFAEHWDFWWLEMTTSHDMGERYRVANLLPNEIVGDLCSRALVCLKSQNEDSAVSYAAALLCLVRDAMTQDETAKSVAQLRFLQAEEYIDSHLSSVTVDALARYIPVTPRTLSSDFHACAGCTPHRYIQQKRLQCAEYLLKNTVKTITEIAEELGYSSLFHFSAAFKKERGCSPLAYRNRF